MNTTFTNAVDDALVMETRLKPRARRRTKPVRLSDVAQAAAVSTATVSMVVNGNPRISSATQKRVRRAIEKLGYRPNRAAQRLNGRGAPAILVLLPADRQAFADPYFGELIGGITDRASRLGQVVQFEHATPDLLRSGHHVSLLQQQSADGMLLFGFNDSHDFLEDFDEVSSRVIAVDSPLSRGQIGSIACDYRGGATQAMNYLLQLGHRRIGLLASRSPARDCSETIAAWRAALAHHGIRADDGWVADGGFTEAGGDEAADRLLRNATQITAILAASDSMAIGAVHRAQRNGLSVPRDLSIVGMGDLRHAAFLNPSLTTVHLPLHDVGARACQRLIDSIKGNIPRVEERLATHLIVRNSTSLARDIAAPLADSSAA